MKETSDKSQWKAIQQNTCPVPLKIVKVVKQGKLRNCGTQEEAQEKALVNVRNLAWDPEEKAPLGNLQSVDISVPWLLVLDAF